jgi:bleomycin hydrolase
MTRTTIAAALLMLPFALNAQQITPQVLDNLRNSYQPTPQDKAVRNAVGKTDMRNLVFNQDQLDGYFDTHFTYRVPQKGITDQKSSGRCWLFCGLNILRAEMRRTHPDLGDFFFSQNYLFFYDQLEKSNLFLQTVIDTRKLPMDDRKVESLFHSPLSDGGTFTGVADLVNKYGLVPSEVMHETFSANNTARMHTVLVLKLREYGLELREMKGSDKQLVARKEEQLKTIYRILSLTLGTPPQQFTWSERNNKDSVLSTETYTPLQFAEKYTPKSTTNDYIMFMNDPSREYYKVYEVDMDRHTYEGRNWLYLNVPIEDMQEVAIASLKDSSAMYTGCDVGKELDSERGYLSMDNYDYGSLLGVDFPMDKRQRVLTFASGSSHAMALVAVDIKDGKPVKWMVENSWGEKSGHKGHLIMTDDWFRNYMFRLVAETKYVPERLRAMMSQKPVKLPMWDPMFQVEE